MIAQPAAPARTGISLTLVALALSLAQGPPGGGLNFGPVTDGQYRNGGQFNGNVVELGRLLFFDEILSGPN